MFAETYVVLLLQLIAGIQAIQSPGTPVSPRRAALYARAALHHGIKNGVDPFDLIALARNESDFQERNLGADGLDCGITQTRITYSRYTCKELMESPWLAFAEAARELSAYQRRCRDNPDYDRCRLNRYNSGMRYARRGFHGRYYLRVSCFAEAARHRAEAGRRCRTVHDRQEIALLLHGKVPPEDEAPRLAGSPSLPGSALQSNIVPRMLAPWAVTVEGIAQPHLQRGSTALVGDSRRLWLSLGLPRWPHQGPGLAPRPQDMMRRSHSTS